MSSLVLTSSLVGTLPSVTAYVSFLTRRAARIYPALWLSVGLAYVYLALRAWLPAAPDRSAWLLAIDTYHVTAGDVRGSLLGARDALVPPLWSIKIELLASLIVPGLAWLLFAGRRGQLLLYGFAAVLAVYSMWAGLDGEYLVDFALGTVALSWIIQPLGANRLSRGHACALRIAFLLAMLLFRNLNRGWGFDIAYHAPAPALAEGFFAAAFLIVLETSDLTGSVLLAPVLVWLGDISYSIYLLHFPVMELSSRVLALIVGQNEASRPNIEAAALTITTLGLVLPLSHLCYRQVERRGIAAGAWLLSTFAAMPRLARRHVGPNIRSVRWASRKPTRVDEPCRVRGRSQTLRGTGEQDDERVVT